MGLDKVLNQEKVVCVCVCETAACQDKEKDIWKVPRGKMVLVVCDRSLR